MEPDGSGSPSQKPNTCPWLAPDQSRQNYNRTLNLKRPFHIYFIPLTRMIPAARYQSMTKCMIFTLHFQ